MLQNSQKQDTVKTNDKSEDAEMTLYAHLSPGTSNVKKQLMVNVDNIVKQCNSEVTSSSSKVYAATVFELLDIVSSLIFVTIFTIYSLIQENVIRVQKKLSNFAGTLESIALVGCLFVLCIFSYAAHKAHKDYKDTKLKKEECDKKKDSTDVDKQSVLKLNTAVKNKRTILIASCLRLFGAIWFNTTQVLVTIDAFNTFGLNKALKGKSLLNTQNLCDTLALCFMLCGAIIICVINIKSSRKEVINKQAEAALKIQESMSAESSPCQESNTGDTEQDQCTESKVFKYCRKTIFFNVGVVVLSLLSIVAKMTFAFEVEGVFAVGPNNNNQIGFKGSVPVGLLVRISAGVLSCLFAIVAIALTYAPQSQVEQATYNSFINNMNQGNFIIGV